jgi:hypothetical protein
MNDSKQDRFPINEENLRRTAEHLATVGPFVRRRAAEAGRQIAESLTRVPCYRGTGTQADTVPQ